MSTMTSSLLHTALQNLHVAQQGGDTPLSRPPSSPGMPRRRLSPDSSDGEGDEMVQVGQGTRPGTPQRGQKGLTLGQRIPKNKDPLRTLPTHLAVRVFLQLDIRSLARCDRVCKRWQNSSTLNYVWFLQNRALLIPNLGNAPLSTNGKTRRVDAEIEFFDPYDKTPRLSALPMPPMPTSQTPQWTKTESKKAWKSAFRATLKRTDPNAEPEVDPLRVDISSLHSSGFSTPSGHTYSGLGSGGANKWAGSEADGTALTSTERKIAARETYKAMGGRKSRAKRKMGGELGTRDKGGAVDDGRFDAPW